MEDIYQSLYKAEAEQKWIFGDKAIRLGSPFRWSDTEHKPTISKLKDLLAVAFFFSMFYVKRPFPEEYSIKDHDQIYEHHVDRLKESFRHFFPFLTLSDSWKNYIESQALLRSQDYCFIKKFCPDLEANAAHMDIGPGLGSTAIYSLKYLNSQYYGVEASAMSYSVQRKYLSFLSPHTGAYLDTIECENFQLTKEEILKELNNNPDYRIKHLPSWHLPYIPSESMNLITATFVLNEVNHSAILWLLSHASRVLRQGGYFYIRDSFILKPGLHDIEYDNILLKMGFENVFQLEFTDRHDFFGIPRIFQKKSDKYFSFDELVDICLGKFTVVSPGGLFTYNRDKK